MIEIYGEDGAITENVLEQMYPSYRLHAAEVNFKDAILQLQRGGPFSLPFI